MLLVAFLLNGSLIGYGRLVPGPDNNLHVADTDLSAPLHEDGSGHGLASLFYATVATAFSEQLPVAALDGPAAPGSLNSRFSNNYTGTRVAGLAARVAGGVLLSHSHLFCVYRL
jgi:hypothetical protein